MSPGGIKCTMGIHAGRNCNNSCWRCQSEKGEGLLTVQFFFLFFFCFIATIILLNLLQCVFVCVICWKYIFTHTTYRLLKHRCILLNFWIHCVFVWGFFFFPFLKTKVCTDQKGILNVIFASVCSYTVTVTVQCRLWLEMLFRAFGKTDMLLAVFVCTC